MIEITTRHHCRDCESENIVKNGRNRYGNQQYLCRDCGSSKVLVPKVRYTEEKKEEILRSYQERSSLRGVSRIFNVSRQTVASWLKKKFEKAPTIEETVAPVQNEDTLEIDELWSFVYRRSDQVWLWTVMCRRTRQIIAYVNGDHSDETCQVLWDRIPDSYKKCHSFSDFWGAYKRVFPEETHRLVGKETGETAHMERWNNTLRQRISRFVRETLSFSKDDWWHDQVTKLFIVTYNLSCTI